MPREPKILLAGTGAVGSYYGARLAQGGASVSVLCRSDYDAVKKNGIEIRSVDGDFQFFPEQVIRLASEYGAVPDYIIVATKVLPEIDLPGLIGEKVSPGTSIVLLQNGIDIEDPVVSSFPENEIISAIAFISVSRPELGHIVHRDYGRIIIGRYPSGSSQKVELLARSFERGGVSCGVETGIVTARWKKLMWNAPFNPISVLGGGISTREMIESPPILALIRGTMEEVLLLAEKSGHSIPASTIDKNIEDTLKMAPSKTSMLQDFEKKHPVEVEAILGNTLRIARKLGVQVPRLESLYGLLKILDEKNRSR